MLGHRARHRRGRYRIDVTEANALIVVIHVHVRGTSSVYARSIALERAHFLH